MNYYKLTNKSERHFGMKYNDGLNTDILDFNPSGNCQPGGIYFAREDIFAFLGDNYWIRQLTLPDGESIYENPGTPKKWKAHRVILGKRERITGAVIKRLITEGADVHACDDYALCWASGNGHTEIVKLLLDSGADVHADDDYALCCASDTGHTEIVKLLLDSGADVHAGDDNALWWASENGHTEIVKLIKGYMR